MRFALDTLWLLLLAIASPWLAYRFAFNGEWRHVPQRCALHLGTPQPGTIWLHGASVGEITLLKPLVAQLELAYPDTPLVISALTATGVAAARKAFPCHRVIMLPLDLSFLMRRVLAHFTPRLLVIVETEFWPNLLLAARTADVPVAVVNAKMSPRSARRYSRTLVIPRLLRHVAVIGAQNAEFRDRFVDLGVAEERIVVTGNMKYDLTDPGRPQDAAVLRDSLGYSPGDVVVIGGSLHRGEDDALLKGFRDAGARGASAALILVPRYPHEADRVTARAQAIGFDVVRKSDVDAGMAPAPGASGVLLVDTLGELGRLYRVADIAFVGGSLFYRGTNKGGHNLMEPAVLGVPVLFGPYNFSFRDTVSDLLAADAGMLVHNADELTAALARLIADPQARRERGERGRAVVMAGRGATGRNFELLAHILGSGGRCLPASGFDSTMPPATGGADPA